jgi:ubiquinone/menaquinone biosynthesis C-methylase UbiE
MDNNWNENYKQMWEERYQAKEYAYGEIPNEFFASWLVKFKPGCILMPADGEGRNGVFAAKSGWKVCSFDLSAEGKKKALSLAASQHVKLNYQVGDLETMEFEPQSFDAIALIYAHFAADRKSVLHKKLQQYLKPGGCVLLEGFSKNHLDLVSRNPKVGGPKDINQLFSLKELAEDFRGYQFLLLEETKIELNEGKHHIGEGAVARMIAVKPSNL